MDTIYDLVGLNQTTAPVRLRVTVFSRCWAALREWRKRERSRAELHQLSDRELRDIGVTRGEIDYVVSHRSIEPLSVVFGVQVQPDWYEEYWLKPTRSASIERFISAGTREGARA